MRIYFSLIEMIWALEIKSIFNNCFAAMSSACRIIVRTPTAAAAEAANTGLCLTKDSLFCILNHKRELVYGNIKRNNIKACTNIFSLIVGIAVIQNEYIHFLVYSFQHFPLRPTALDISKGDFNAF